MGFYTLLHRAWNPVLVYNSARDCPSSKISELNKILNFVSV